MAISAGLVTVDVIPRLAPGAEAQLNAQVTAASQKATSSLGSTGATLTKAITLPMVALGAAALASANQVDEGMKIIRAGTGATGDTLDELGDSFTGVLKTVPQDAATVASALADLNTRTGATGEQLEGLTTQLLNLSRVAGEDVSGLVADTTRLFGDWSVATEDQAAQLDHLWKVSQTTGIGVSKLSQDLVTYGAQFRGFGFTVDEAAALLGSFERDGVATSKMLAGLSTGLGRAARSGEEPREVFDRLVETIQNTESKAEQVTAAIEIFGAKAGPDMAAAIAEGRFAVDELMATIDASGETIAAAAEDTLTLGDRFGILKNQATTALAPLGESLLGVLQAAMPVLGAMAEGVGAMAEGFSALPSGVQTGVVAIAGFGAAIGPTLSMIDKLKASKLADWATKAGSALTSVVPSLGALGGPIGIAAGAAVVTLGAAWAAGQKRAKEFAADVGELTGAVIDQTGAMNLGAEAWATYILESSRFNSRNQIDDLKRMGVTASEIQDALLGDAEAMRAFVLAAADSGEIKLSDNLREMVENADDVPEALFKIIEAAARTGEASGNVDLLRSMLHELGVTSETAQQALDQLRVKGADLVPQEALDKIDQLEAGGADATAILVALSEQGLLTSDALAQIGADGIGIDGVAADGEAAKAALDGVGNSATNVASGLDNVRGAADVGGEALGRIGQTAQLTEDDVNALNDALTLLLGGFLSSERAAIAFAESDASLRSSLTESAGAIAANAGQLNLQDQALRGVNSNILSYIESATRQAQADIEAGAAVSEVTARLGTQADALEQVLRQAGLSEAEIRRYVGALREVPDTVSTTVSTPGAAEASEAVRVLGMNLGNIPTERRVQIHIESYGVAEANRAAAAALAGRRASGGPIDPNKVYLVGEEGPELFVSKDAGQIVPNEALNQARSGLSQTAIDRISENPRGEPKPISITLNQHGVLTADPEQLQEAMELIAPALDRHQRSRFG